MAVGSGQQNLVRAALQQDRPVVLDADGLNNLVMIDRWPDIRKCPLILTPHPGEFSRLTGRSVKQIQSGRQNAAVEAARKWGKNDKTPLVVVLKGAGTVVTDGRRIYVNPTGNPGMATGGTGDVLTGLTGAMLGQGLEPFEAACLAAWCHGRAGDLAARKLGRVSLIASDLLEYLPIAIRESARRA
jgi:NAD(P)H-hydrate epimerase